jgi:S-methylmethionine-dependent homocysteine/selenocysteine methylase
LADRIASDAPLFLDGPTGTALEGRGFRSHPSLWTASAAENAAELLAAVHRDYLRAGAEAVTANTFRTTAFAAEQAGLAEPIATARRWLFATVAVARACASEFSEARSVLGSLAPLADCYAPQNTPSDVVLRREHRRTAEWLIEAGCDAILVETQGCGREVRIAVAEAVSAGGVPVLVSFLPDTTGTQLLDGDSLLAAATDCVERGAQALLVNCAPSDVLLKALTVLRPLAARGVLLGAYPNAARMTLVDGVWRWASQSRGADLAAASVAFRRTGARIIGACCGYAHDDLAAMKSAFFGADSA